MPTYVYEDTPQGRVYYGTQYNPAGERVDDPAVLQELQSGKLTATLKGTTLTTQPTTPMASGTQAPTGTTYVGGAPYAAGMAPGQTPQQPVQQPPQYSQSGFTNNVQPTYQQPQQPQNAPKPAPTATQPIDYTFHAGQETIEQYNARIAAARGYDAAQAVGKGTQQAPQAAPQTTPQGAGTLTMPATGSVVDLLNMAGQDSSYAARQQLAAQYGIQKYQGTAAQNTELAQKYLAAYNAQKGAVPNTPAAAQTALQSYFDDQKAVVDPQAAFIDAFANLDPISAMLFQQIAQIDSVIANRPTYTQMVNEELSKSGVTGLKEDLAQTIADIRLTEDQVREELAGGGVVLEGQVRGVAAARTKVLLTKAEQLSNIISAKEEAVDRMIQLIGMDRADVDAQFNKKLGLTNMLYTMQTRMEDRARENYELMINSMGWDKFGQLLSQNPAQQFQAERALGLPQGTLSNPTALSLFSPTPKWSDPYKLGNNYVQMNMETGEIQSVSSLGDNGLAGILSMITGKPLSEGERLSSGYAQRMFESDATIDAIGGQFIGGTSAFGEYLPNVLKSADRQKFEQAQRNFINAVLRRESGAVISPEEFANARQQYFPQPGDTQQVLNQKDKNRQTVINSMYISGGQLQTPSTSNDPLGIL